MVRDPESHLPDIDERCHEAENHERDAREVIVDYFVDRPVATTLVKNSCGRKSYQGQTEK